MAAIYLFWALSSRIAASPTSDITPTFASRCNKGTGTPQLCVAINVPGDEEAKNDLYLKVTGPSTRQYTGIGFGKSMTDSLMLLIFPDSGNVTTSMRLSSGHSRPALAAPEIQAELLAGSVSDATSFTANVKCRNCRKWSTGALTVDGPADLIYAYGLATGAGDKAVTTYHGPFSHGAFQLYLSSNKETVGGVPPTSGTPVR